MKRIIYLIVLAVLFAACDDGSEPFERPTPVPPGGGGEGEEIEYAVRSKEMFDKISKDYKVSGTSLYAENYPAQSGDPQYSYLWSLDAMVSAAAVLTELDYDVDYAKIADSFEKYYSNSHASHNVGGYSSSTDNTSGKGDRFYDDNSIVGLNLIQAYRITGNVEYLDRAKRIVAFLKSGIDSQLGGALWWNESLKNIPGNPNSNKPACANGYATQFLLQYHQVCTASEKAEVLEIATGLYDWLRLNLHDPYTKCYWNDVNVNGDVNKTIWTYNTGVMVQNGLMLYKITKKQQYLDEAKASVDGSYDYFAKIRNGVLSFPDSDPWFNTKLLGAYVDLYPYHNGTRKYIETYTQYIDHAYEKARTQNGYFYEDWTGASPKRYHMLLMQACVVESYGLIEIFNTTYPK